MRRWFLAVTAFLLVPFMPAWGQETFKPAVIYLAGADKLTGYVKTFLPRENLKYVVFKRELDSHGQKISIAQIDSMTIGDSKYITAEVKIDPTVDNIHLLSYQGEIQYKTAKVLLRVLFQGEKSLYFYSYRKRDLFYIKEGDSIVLLEAPFYMVADSSGLPPSKGYHVKHIGPYMYMMQSDRFRYQLAGYFSDCPFVMDKINKTDYSLHSLYGLFKTYYSKCKQSEVSYYKTRLYSQKFRSGIQAGMWLEYMNFTSNTFGLEYLTKLNYTFSPTMYCGVFGMIDLGGFLNDWSVNFSLNYFETRATGEGSWSYPLIDYYGTSSMFISGINTNFDVRHRLMDKNNLSLGYSIGMDFNIPINYYDSVHVVKNVLGSTTEYDIDSFVSAYDGQKLLNINSGFKAGLFLNYKRYGLDLTYNYLLGYLPLSYIRQIDMRVVLTFRVTLN